MPIQVLTCSPGVGWATTVGASRAIAVALPNDEETSYVAGTGLAVFTADVSNPSLAGVTVTNVQVVTRGRTVGIIDNMLVEASIDGFTTTSSHLHPFDTTYSDISLSMLTKPGGGAWAIGDIDNLQVRVTTPDITEGRITTLYVNVHYESASGRRNNAALGHVGVLEFWD